MNLAYIGQTNSLVIREPNYVHYASKTRLIETKIAKTMQLQWIRLFTCSSKTTPPFSSNGEESSFSSRWKAHDNNDFPQSHKYTRNSTPLAVKEGPARGGRSPFLLPQPGDNNIRSLNSLRSAIICSRITTFSWNSCSSSSSRPSSSCISTKPGFMAIRSRLYHKRRLRPVSICCGILVVLGYLLWRRLGQISWSASTQITVSAQDSHRSEHPAH